MINLEQLKINTKEVTKASQQYEDDYTKVEYDLKGFKPLYPTSKSNLRLKIFYNRPTETLAREFSRHRFIYNDKKFRVQPPCLKTFGMECPICKKIKEIQDIKGKDILKNVMVYQRKCMSFAYVEEVISHPSDDVKAGDLVLFIYPKSLLNKLEDILTRCSTAEEASKFFDRNDSVSFTLSANPGAASGGDAYNFIPDAIKVTPIFTGDDANDRFEKLMNSLPSLNDIYMPQEPTEEMIALNNEVATELSKRYLSENSPESTTAAIIEGELKKQQVLKQIPPVQIQIPVQQPQPQVQPTINSLQNQVNQEAAAQVVQPTTTIVNPINVTNPTVNPVVPTTTQPVVEQVVPNIPTSTNEPQATGPVPECFGKYSDIDAKCLLCPSATECSTKK